MLISGLSEILKLKFLSQEKTVNFDLFLDI